MPKDAQGKEWDPKDLEVMRQRLKDVGPRQPTNGRKSRPLGEEDIKRMDEESETTERLQELQREIENTEFEMAIAKHSAPDPDLHREYIREKALRVTEIARIARKFPHTYRRHRIDYLINSAEKALAIGDKGQIAAKLNWGLNETVDLGFGRWATKDEADELHEQALTPETRPSHHYVFFSGKTVIFDKAKFSKNSLMQKIYYLLSDLRKRLKPRHKRIGVAVSSRAEESDSGAENE